ncbi:hypothetical protein EDC94DRAFT_565908 [Helicostylum pulchrum]|nr:hypothetical protein EDC94DRAFT_565908 [Helicostylum pulchrum]
MFEGPYSENEESLDTESRSLSQEEEMSPPLPLSPLRDSDLCNQPTSLTPSVLTTPYLEDGPIFRATLFRLECRTSTLRTNVKQIIDTLTKCLEVRHRITGADKSYLYALRDTPCVEPLMSHFLNNASKIRDKKRKQLYQSSAQLYEFLKAVYDCDIKVAEKKRKQFGKESDDYYASLNGYLKAANKINQKADKKQNQRKSSFECARFNYYAYLIDLHERKEADILLQVTNHAMEVFNFHESVTQQRLGLNVLLGFVTENSSTQELAATERTNKYRELTAIWQSYIDDDTTQGDIVPVTAVRDQNLGVEKEGFLFATAKLSKGKISSSTTLHQYIYRYWCILSEGQLQEYSKWKEDMGLHLEPINLTCARVREAPECQRRFCFEVITPHIRRIYQATSQAEVQSWMGTIRNSNESLLNSMTPSTSTPQNNERQSTNMIQQSLLAEGSELLASASPSPRLSALSSIRQQTSNNDNGDDNRLLSILRHDKSNHYCADCGLKDPDWCSLNLGVLLCLECCGIHRSLGQDISETLSLTLDFAVYRPELIELLISTGNAQSNLVWASQYEPSNTADTTLLARPRSTDCHATKLAFAQAKYISRFFVKNTTEDANELLFEAIDRDNIQMALYALAVGADVNSYRLNFSSSPRTSLFSGPSSGTRPMKSFRSSSMKTYTVRYALHYSLLHGRYLDSEDATARSEKDYPIIFPMAEFLLQNGADTGITDTLTGYTLAELINMGSVVDDQAKAYINLRNMDC